MDSAAERAAELVAAAEVPGIQLALVAGGEPVSGHAFGVTDRERLTPLSVADLFQAASLAKCLTAWAVMRLAEQGRIDLDSPVQRYFTRWRLPPSGFDHAAVTVRRVLCHTAGLSLSDYPGFEPARTLPGLEASLSGDTNGGGDLRAIEPAGRSFRYSGGGYTLLALAIEEITGERFAAHMARNVLEPLGMSASTFDQGSGLVERSAAGHDANGRTLPFYRFDGAAAAGLFTTADDLARFAAAHLAGPRGEAPGRGVLSPRTIATMTAPLVGTGRVDGLWPEYGLGYEVERRPDGRTLVGHHGANRGWRALLAIEPARSRALAALANSDLAQPALESLAAAWLDAK